MKCWILLAIIFKWILKITSLPKLNLIYTDKRGSDKKSIKFNDNKSHRFSIRFMESNSFNKNMGQKKSQR